MFLEAASAACAVIFIFLLGVAVMASILLWFVLATVASVLVCAVFAAMEDRND